MRKMLAVMCAMMVAPAAVGSEINYEASGTGYIYRVIDGDTIIASGIGSPAFEVLAERVDPKWVNHKYRSIRMRIDGINTAESGTAGGDEATRFLTSKANRSDISFRCYDVGYYGRALCNVMFGANVDIGAMMIETGRSDYFTKYGGVPYPKLDRLYRSLEGD